MSDYTRLEDVFTMAEVLSDQSDTKLIVEVVDEERDEIVYAVFEFDSDGDLIGVTTR